MYELLMKLKSSGIGCHIGPHYVGALGYADDLVLMSPSRNGLQKMLQNCEEFGEEYNVVYNSKKNYVFYFHIN